LTVEYFYKAQSNCFRMDLELLEIIWVAELIAEFDDILRLCSK